MWNKARLKLNDSVSNQYIIFELRQKLSVQKTYLIVVPSVLRKNHYQPASVTSEITELITAQYNIKVPSFGSVFSINLTKRLKISKTVIYLIFFTAVVVTALSAMVGEPNIFEANRPYFYFIRSNQNIIFCGSYTGT